jgi:signal transduction histidine kinase
MKPPASAVPIPDFGALFHGAPGRYVALTPDFTIVAVSDAYLRATMTERATILGRRLVDVLDDQPPDTVGQLRASLDRVRQTRAPDAMAVHQRDVRRPESDGGGVEARQWRATNVPVFDREGGLAYIIHSLEDVTDSVRNERRLERLTAELERSTKELESLSYSVSHDLRAPLRAIDGFSQAVLEDHGPTLAADGHRLLSTIRQNTQRMGRLIDDLVRFARLARKPLELAPVDLTEIAEAVVRELRQADPERRIDVTVAVLPSVRGDYALLRQVFSHLIGNAFKFTRHRLDARVEIGSRDEGDETACYVRDNGAGFDMRHASRLFGMFQRLHRDEEFEGAGVGLAVVQRIIHRHGGRVWAEGRVDEGATFCFTLPAGSEAEHAGVGAR